MCGLWRESYDVFSVENDAARFIDMPSGSISQKRDVQREMEMDAAVSAFFPEYDGKSQRRVLREDGMRFMNFCKAAYMHWKSWERSIYQRR